MSLVRKRGQALQKRAKDNVGVAFFLGNGVGSVTGQQREQCLNREGQKG